MRKFEHTNHMGLKNFLLKKKQSKLKKRNKVGLCLSGGGARGFCYLGAFKAFEENGIKFDMVAGASAGSLFGALYASKLSYDQIIELTKGIKTSDFRKPKLGFLPSKTDILNETLKKVYPIKRIEDLPIPLFVVAVNLKDGKEIDFTAGDLTTTVCGSCAIPGVFLPVKYKNMVLVDGGVRNNIPADVLRYNGCNYVVTIDCNCTRGGGTNSENIINQFFTSIGITMSNNSTQGKILSDILICPDMKKFSSLKIVDVAEMIKQGYTATMSAMPEIKQLFLGKLKRKQWRKQKK